MSRSCLSAVLIRVHRNGFYCNTCYSTQSIIKTSKNREKRLLQKLVKGSVPKKRRWCESQDMKNYLPMSRLPFKSCNNRRMAMLNKVFMKYITDLLATGEVAPDVVGRGLQISRVEISADFQNLGVYWLSQNPSEDREIEKVLVGCAGHLRHELSQLHVVGAVPRIEFVKDTQFTKLMDVDHLLSQADYGDDYTPVHARYYQNAKFTQNLDVSHTQSGEKSLPAMKMDVFGLDHAIILNKIQKALTKAEASHRNVNHVSEVESYAADKDAASNVTSSSAEGLNFSKKELSRFLSERQIAKEKELKRLHNFRPELELYDAEQFDDEKYLESFLNDIEDKDFMVDGDDDDDDNSNT